jgi:GH15 family glucan-1,4-alpha-glucosidase
MAEEARHRLIGDYALIGDCHAAALVSRAGSIDWCCMPRFDSGSIFGRLLDADRGGFCSLGPHDTRADGSRRYLDGTLVLETRFQSSSGEARLLDCFTMRGGGAEHPYRQLLRVVEGTRGGSSSSWTWSPASTTARSSRGSGAAGSGCTPPSAATTHW